MNSDEKRAVVFLPWLRIEEPLRIADVDFFPLRNALEKVAGNIDLVRQVDAIVGQYRLDPLHSENNAIICATSKDPFAAENADNYDCIREASRLLATCSIAANEYFRGSDRYTNSSCFELVGQRFIVGDYHTSYVSRRRDGRTQDMGYAYDTAVTLAPPWIRQANRFDIQYDLLNGFQKLRETAPKEFRRLLIAQEWFLSGWTDSPTISVFFDAIAIASAFDQSHQSDMSPNLLTSIFSSGRTTAEAGGGLDKKGNWYKGFRDKRNAIIHGSPHNTPKVNDLWLDVFIASQVLLALWKRLLVQQQCYLLTKDDIELEFRMDLLIERRDPSVWNDRLEAAKRRALRELEGEIQVEEACTTKR
jgi:hypothetical protein